MSFFNKQKSVFDVLRGTLIRYSKQGIKRVMDHRPVILLSISLQRVLFSSRIYASLSQLSFDIA